MRRREGDRGQGICWEGVVVMGRGRKWKEEGREECQEEGRREREREKERESEKEGTLWLEHEGRGENIVRGGCVEFSQEKDEN